jgi:rfaE bifunctional protein kinase chain/domain
MKRPRASEEEGQERRRLLQMIDRFGQCRVAVIGDILADEFIYGRVARVSREAPVLILEYAATEVVPGGAGNAANNVAALGGRVAVAGIVGRDESGRRLVASLHTRVEREGLLRLPGYRTPTKTRILAGGVHSAKQQVVRIDREIREPIDTETSERFGRLAEEAALRSDAVIFSDYGYGRAVPALVQRVRARRDRMRARPIPLLVDSRYDLLRFRGLTACTPNESEVEQILGVRIDDDPAVLERAGRDILGRTAMSAVLVTRGSRGMALFEPRRPTRHIPIFGSDQIADVTGAGDTVIATLTIALASGASFIEAARLANYAGGLVVMKRGTATVSADELRHAVRADAP